MPSYSDPLNEDVNEIKTSFEKGDPGDGSDVWYAWVKSAVLGELADAAITNPATPSTLMSVIRGVLTHLATLITNTSKAATGLLKAEDEPHVSGDYGVQAFGVASLARTARSADNDNSIQAVDLAGAQFVLVAPEANAAWATSLYAAHAAASGVIKATAGKLYTCKITNDNAAMQYVMFFNLTAVPADGVAPLFAVCVPAKSTLPLNWLDLGRYFTTGICWSSSSTFATKTIGVANDISIAATYL